MEPKYSVLYFKENIDSLYKDFVKFLQRGVKVFWFGNENEREILRSDFEPFAKAFFLQAFSLDEIEGNHQFGHQIII